MTTTQLLFVYGAVFLLAAANIANVVVKRRRTKRDDLMALADTLHVCGAVYRAMAVDHRWHDCNQSAGHERGHSHHCRCGVRWVTPIADDVQIQLLDRMLGADAYEPDRRTS